MSSSPSDLVRRWPTLVAILSTRKLRTPDLRNLLELVLSDGDDPTEAELTGKEETQTPSPRLTPVERLLLLLTQVDLSFRRKLVDLEPTDDDNRKYWQALTYLKRLLVMSLSQATPARALSDVERTRLYAQLTSVSFHCARLNPIRGRWRRSTRLISEHHLDALGSRLERLPSADRDVEQLKTLWLYRKARAIVRSAPENASALLASLFQRSGGVVPKGIFFHASRALFDLPPSRRKDVLAQSRVAIATTFARLGVRRVLDRIALLICLVQDAIYADAADTADALYDAEREFSSAMFTDLSFVAPHARSELNRLRHDVFSQLDAMPRPVCADTDMGRLYAALPRRLRGDFEKSGRHIPEGWETFEPGDDVPLR